MKTAVLVILIRLLSVRYYHHSCYHCCSYPDPVSPPYALTHQHHHYSRAETEAT